MPKAPALTIGIEEEFQLIDPVTRDLKSHILQIIEDNKTILAERVKPEIHQSVAEVGTGICQTAEDAAREVKGLRTFLKELAEAQGLRIAAAGTHPFADWRDQKITPNDHYDRLIEEMQLIARANLIFGLHVHIGIEDRDLQIQIMNEFRYFLPHLLALSTNSPFWLGSNTGLKSFRSKVFDRYPRTNIPDSYADYSEFDNFVKLLIKTGCIDTGKKIWWDIRPHPVFPTLEVRVCDIPLRMEETITLAALMQAIAAKLYKLRAKNLGYRQYRRALIMENKWRASRYGIRGKLVDFGKEDERDEVDLINELVEFVDDVVDDLGSRKQIETGIKWI
ncbi:MAG TPA: carboxylate-amine ligase, partial [Candidatus Kapabacteria bacterium]|nr:carboxylate-amine ligase [Candidatus Kapabacteria bacterium]